MRTLRLGIILFLRTMASLSVVACILLCTCDAAGQLASGITFTSIGKHATALACIKRLPDGAHVYLHQKVVTCTMGKIFYIEEPDRSSGIKVDLGTNYYFPIQLVRGNFVNVTGVMATCNGERVVLAECEPEYDYTSLVAIRPIGMNMAAILGWPVNFREPFGSRVRGLMPTGLYVKIWGKATLDSTPDENGDGTWYCYLDDGWGKFDGSIANAKGIRIYTTCSPSIDDEIWCASGVLSTRLSDPSPVIGDEVVIPCILTTNGVEEFHIPGDYSMPQNYGLASGRVRLVGRQAPGKEVRVYSEKDSVILNNVTDQWTSFTLHKVPESGMPVSAGAPGYISATRVVHIGDNNVDFELQPSDSYTDILSDRDSIAICSSETAFMSAIQRDCEGKGLEGQQLRLTTTAGIFTETNTNELIGTTDVGGCVNAHLSAGTDGPHVAVVKAETYPSAGGSSQLNVELKGSKLTLGASPKIIDTNGSSSITAHIEINDEIMSSVPLTFSTNKGTFVESGTSSFSTLTDSSGDAHATLMLTSPGTARVLAKYVDNCSHETISWTAVAYARQPWYAHQINVSNPLVVDLDGTDGKKEVVVMNGQGYLVALNEDGSERWSNGLYGTGSGLGNNTASCFPMDSDRSGRPCIFLPVENAQAVYALSYNGRPLAGWPAPTRYTFSKVACAIGDINLDGSPEMVAGDGCCYVWSWNPTGNWMAGTDTDASCLWVNLTGTKDTTIRGSTCALGDIDNDPRGILDVIEGTVSAPGNVFGFQGDVWGSYASSGIYLDNWPKPGGTPVETSPAIGDIDGDGRNDAAWGGGDGNVHIWLSSTDSQVLCKIGDMIYSSPALADIDGDGKLDVIIGSVSGCVFAFNWLGQSIPGWENGIHLDPEGNHSVKASVSVGDVTGDGQLDVVAVCGNGFVYALYGDGVNHVISGEHTGPIAWVDCWVPSASNVTDIYNGPVIDDLDNDGHVEIIVAGTQGIYRYHLSAPYTGDPLLYPWPTFHRDNRRSGCATSVPTPVNASIQGIISHNGTPVVGAKVYIYKDDGSTVYVPYSAPPVSRDYVLSVGSADPQAAGRGAYCISQLEPDQTYKIKVEATGYTTKWVTNIAAATGLIRVDVAL